MSSVVPRPHALILRLVVAFFLVVYVFQCLVAVLAAGPELRWSTAALVGYLVSLVLALAVFAVAIPAARWAGPSPLMRIYTKATIRLVSALLVGQLGLMLVFAVDAGVTPGFLGAGTAVIMMLGGVWPYRSGAPQPAAPATAGQPPR